MATSDEKWFVEEFHLRGPIEEFQESCRQEIDRLRDADPRFDDQLHREAAALVLRRLSGDKKGGRA